MRRALLALAAAATLASCEDGPEQIFTPNDGDPVAQNGYDPASPWVQDGEKSYDYTAGSGDSVDRARFCDEREMTDTLNTMVVQPIVPDVSLGGIPMWSAAGTPSHANDLIGRPEDGKFCDPDVYSNALAWGPTYEIIAFINEETKLVETLVATEGYQGKLEGAYTAENDVGVNVLMQMRERVRIGAVELDKYTSSANQEANTNSWLNHGRIVEMYKMIRETFFGSGKLGADDADCFATQICGVIYTAADESQPQTTLVLFRDSGLYLAFSPEGHLIEVDLEPVKVAKFETAVTLSMLDGSGRLAPALVSASQPGCDLDLGGQTWKDFRDGCVDATDTRTISRASYDVYTARDAVDVNFNGVTLSYLRRTTVDTLLKDGEHPADTDTLFGLAFYRDLNAPVAEFVPTEIAALYKARLEARLQALVAGSPGHPLATYRMTVPADLGATAEPIGALLYRGGTKSLVDEVVSEVKEVYAGLTPEQQAVAAPVLHPVYLIEPFVDAVLSAFSGGRTDVAGVFKGFEVTDDRRWSIGLASFKQDGVPMRLVVQYSLNYGAVTAVSVEAGQSALDDQYDKLLHALGGYETYYGIEQSWHTDSDGNPSNPLGLSGTGLTVGAANRQLGTVDVDLKVSDAAAVSLRVPGTRMEDQAGFYAQVRGERYEFIPAHEVDLLGKETQMVFWVAETPLSYGEAGCTETTGCLQQSVIAAYQPSFKTRLSLCAGLKVGFGDDLRAKIDAWARTVDPDAFAECEIVYNYSANGNLLSSVTSLANKISFDTSDGRATAATVWQ